MSSTTNAEEKKPVEENKYAIISRESIKVYGESRGQVEFTDEVAGLLAEDVTYRLREAVQNSCQFMRHAKRKKLTTDDFNKALKCSDVQPIHGYGSPEPLAFRQTREGEIVFAEDLEVNLANVASSTHAFPVAEPMTVKAQWLAVEGIQKLPANSSVSTSEKGKIIEKPQKGLSEHLLNYYDNMTKAILGTDVEVMKIALTDLRTNSKIAPLLPYFVNFISNGVRTVSHDITQLTKLLHTVKSLIVNQSLYLEPKPYLDLLVQGVVYCVLEPLAASINPLNDHWVLRDYAARLLALITRTWSNSMNQLLEQNVLALKDVLYDPARPFCSHYGAVMGLIALGPQAVEDVLLPHLGSYWSHLQTVMEDVSHANAQVKADGHKVLGAILLAAEFIFHNRASKLLTQTNGLNEFDYPAVAFEQPPTPTVQSHDTTTQDLMTSSNSELMTSQLATELSKSVSGAEVKTSTPVKSEVIQESVALLASKMELFDQPPHILLLDIYREFYEYFGDSLAMRLPIRHIENRYIKMTVNFEVRLGDEDSKRSGEELLKIFMETSTVNVAPEPTEMEVADEDSKSVNSEFEPTPDDIDVDMDEKSDMSYRSDRSDEHSFSGKETLTVKTTVNDPARGIKLTFRKVKPPPPPEPEPEIIIEKVEKPKSESKHNKKRKQSLKSMKLPDVFDRVILKENRPLVFNVEGFTLVPPRDKADPALPGGCKWGGHKNDFRKMVLSLPPFGKNKISKLNRKYRTGFFNILI